MHSRERLKLLMGLIHGQVGNTDGPGLVVHIQLLPQMRLVPITIITAGFREVSRFVGSATSSALATGRLIAAGEKQRTIPSISL